MKKYFIYGLLCLGIIACNHKDDIFEGPSLEDQYGDYNLVQSLSFSKSQIDFSANDQVFYAQFSISVNWEIRLTGLTSGATKSITGKSKNIDAENGIWTGGAETFPSFGIEKCLVELTVPSKTNDTIRDTFAITGLKVNSALNIVADFENGIDSTTVEWSQTTVAQIIVCGDGNAAKGNCYYSLGGNVPWDWGIGNIVFTNPGSYGLSSNASAEFFNMAIKGIKFPGTSIIQVSFQEDDNEDGVFDDATEDSWVYQYTVVDSTWQLVSFSYSTLDTDADGAIVVTNGNQLLEPHKIYSVNAFQLADPNAGEVLTYLDQLVFTNGGPYEP